MNAQRAFGLLLSVACLTGLLVFTVAAGPLVAGIMAHQAEMPMSDGLWDVITVCFSQPDMVPLPVLFLVYMPALLLFSALFTGTWLLLQQWLRTRHAVTRLRALSAGNPRSLQALHSPLSLGSQLLVRLHLQGRVDVIDVSQRFAFCYGWLRPRVCISTGALETLTEQEVEAMLLHERYHMLHLDPLKTALCTALARIFFMLPLVRALQNQYLVAREIGADRYVLAHQTTSLPLLGALYKLIVGYPVQEQARDSMAVARYADCINQRLDYLLSGSAPSGISNGSIWRSMLVLALIALLGGIGTWNSAANTLWHQVYCTLSTCPLMH